MMKNTHAFLLSALCCVTLSACNEQNSQSLEQSNLNDFTLTSSKVSDGGNLPITYTCDGQSISPPLNWSGAPNTTKYYALIMDHKAPEGMHWYWTMYNIAADKTQIKAGETLGEVGSNSVNDLNQYAPPCSKGPGEKSYTYTVYALSAPVTFNSDTKVDRSALLAAVKDITLDTASMTVKYSRSANSAEQKPDSKPTPNEQPKPDKSYLTANVKSPRCDAITQSVSNAGFDQSVSVTCDEQYAYIASSTYPDHDVMTGITGTNEQIPVPAKDYAAPIKLNPKKAKAITTIDAAVGVAVNGVPIYDYSSQGELDVNSYDEKHDTLALGQLDICGGHAGRGDDYHYHVSPTCMIDTMKNQSSDAIIGWAYDGYPLYGSKNPDGSAIAKGDLDVCNGQTDDTFGYRYQTSATPPYIIQCLVGEVDTAKLPRVSPLSGDTQGIRADLRPPQGGVENLTHAISENGSRTMSYSYKGENYFTTYSPASQGKDCYSFKQKTISNGGKVQTGTFCRGPQPNHLTPTVTKQNTNPAITGKHNLKLEAWADNWFTAYIGEQLLVEDSVPITTERSFNAESITFSANYPIELNLIIKDFKQNDTGLEYIGAKNQQMGDGGFIMQLTDTDTNKVVAVSDQSFKCEILHKAPLNKLCESESNPVAGEGVCTFMSKEAPTNWLQSNFDNANWANAVEHNFAGVGPKDGYDDINWDENAKFIWGEDLETDNTLICKATIEQHQ
ncbi:YHYH protein [Pseudoalteromonas sp. NZS11_1]|uniref:YHYH protein n=1 Tax=Pseudoalteromonas sp. NZS11_1 TaxID=2792070 RepID=UPI0018CD417D|nr:YHYH protein [Pseudoalteromonas sp. NZS11_1]MBH0045465.1 YHYH protein [Pseudoalteromonas sp. NZS11_1]